MALIVQKFGGSSVAGRGSAFSACCRADHKTYAAGNDVVVVLSAQGDTTDDLITKAEEINPNASRREMDMLLACGEQQSIALMAMAIESKMGYPVVSLCGWQVGITTNSNHSGRAHPARGLRPRAAGAGSEADRAGGGLPGR